MSLVKKIVIHTIPLNTFLYQKENFLHNRMILMIKCIFTIFDSVESRRKFIIVKRASTFYNKVEISIINIFSF